MVMVGHDDALQTLFLLQVTDSGFPTGAFSYSHGLEGLYTAGLIAGVDEVSAFVTAQLEDGFAGIECPAMALAWRAAKADSLAALVALDTSIDALKPVPVFRIGSVRTGRRLLESAAALLPADLLHRYRAEVVAGRTCGHHAAVFGVVMAAAGIEERTAALVFGASFVNGLTAAAVRLGIIGQQAAQRIIAAHHPAVIRAAEQGLIRKREEMGAYLPHIDIAGLRQPNLTGRVFAS